MIYNALKLNGLPLLLYVLFYGLLFLQFPLHDSLPGNCDTWLAIALSNTYLNKILHSLTGQEITYALYPDQNVHAYGESSPGLGILFVAFKLLVQDDVWAYYLFLVTQFALTSFSLYLLARHLIKSRVCASFVGLIFLCSNFSYSNIDDTLILFYFFPFLSLLLLLKGIEKGREKYLLLSTFCFAIQAYFSFYVLFYQAVLLACFAVFHCKRLLSFPRRTLLCSVFTFLMVISPMLSFYLNNHLFLDIVRPYNLAGIIKSCSITIMDLFKAIPNNILYGRNPDLEVGVPHWASMRRNAFIGGGQIILCILSFKSGPFKAKRPLYILGLLSFFLSMGIFLQFDYHHFVISPFYLFYRYFPFANYLRVAMRIYMLVLFVVSLLAGMGLHSLLSRQKNGLIRWGLLAFFLIVHILENTPFPFAKFELPRAPSYMERVSLEFSPKVVLNLPANIDFNFSDSGSDLYSFNREIMYMNWQTYLNVHTVNGVNGFLPSKRYQLQWQLQHSHPAQLVDILKGMDVDLIILHKRFVLKDEGPSIEAFRKVMAEFMVRENEEYIIWSI